MAHQSAPKRKPVCLFCHQSRDLNSVVNSKVCRGKTVFFHDLCLECSTRSRNETDDDVLFRIATNPKYKCYYCKESGASIKCMFEECKRRYHNPCRILVKAQLSDKGLLCPIHARCNDEQLNKKRFWPKQNGVKYLHSNDWSNISHSDKGLLMSIYTCWEEWEDQLHKTHKSNFRIKQLTPDHWAYSKELETEYGRSDQYELVATCNIEKDTFVGEYTGKIFYGYQNIQKNPYVANFHFSNAAKKHVAKSESLKTGLLLDASECGNEARYMNSVTKDTPAFVKQNASMNTIWHRGQLMIVLIATKAIQKGHPIIGNYDGPDSTYFEYDDSVSDDEKEKRKQKTKSKEKGKRKDKQKLKEKKKDKQLKTTKRQKQILKQTREKQKATETESQSGTKKRKREIIGELPKPSEWASFWRQQDNLLVRKNSNPNRPRTF